MANANGSFGLRPVSKVGQNANTTGASGTHSRCRATPTRSTKVHRSFPITGLLIVGAAAGGTVGLLGVFWGCEYVSSTTGEKIFSNNWPGSGADTNHPVKAFVYDDPMQMYVIASDASLTSEATLRGHVFANANSFGGQSGSDTTGISSALGGQHHCTTNTLNLRIMGWQGDPRIRTSPQLVFP